jgi:hypothetical protein
MKKLIFSFALVASTFVFAQKSKTVRFAIFNDVIGVTQIAERAKSSIASTKAYKAGEKLPADLQKYAFLADNGLTKIELKPNSIAGDLYPLQTFNEGYKLDKNTPVVIDGYTVDASFTIYSDIVASTEVKEKDGRKYLSVTTIK